MKSKKRIDPVVADLLKEISGHKPSHKGENPAKTGVSHDVQVTRGVKPKRATKVTRDLFAKLSTSYVNKQVQVEELSAEIKMEKTRLTEMVETYGTGFLKKKNIVFLAEPWKGLLIWRKQAGAIQTEKVAAYFPELIDSGTETVNLTELEKVLSEHADENTKQFMKKMRAIVSRLEKVSGQTLIEKKDDGLLDMNRYEEYKRLEKVSLEQVKEFESEEGYYALKIDKTPQGPKCSVCGHKRPKRVKTGEKCTCTECGQTE